MSVGVDVGGVCVCVRERDRQTELVVVWRVGYETRGRKDGQGPDVFLLYKVQRICP